jgi:hypothetical protein
MVIFKHKMVHIREFHKIMGTECLKLFQTNDGKKNETEHLMPHIFLYLSLTIFKITNQKSKMHLKC